MKPKFKHSSQRPLQFRGRVTLKKDNPDKVQLRKDLEVATIEYLKTKEIEYQSDSPNEKVISVGIRELSSYSDSPEFYYLEENLNNNPLT